MLRTALLIALVASATACGLATSDDGTGNDHDDLNGSDRGSDRGSDQGSDQGSGSDVAMLVETSPRDHGLEAMSGALGLAIVIAPFGLRRRRPKQ